MEKQAWRQGGEGRGVAIVVSLLLALGMHYLVETPLKNIRDVVRGARL